MHLQSCVHKFRKWLSIAPPTFTRDDDSWEGPYARVLACAYTPDKTVPAFCCYLDGNGLVTDFLRLNNLLKRKYSPFDREREEKVHTHTTQPITALFGKGSSQYYILQYRKMI